MKKDVNIVVIDATYTNAKAVAEKINGKTYKSEKNALEETRKNLQLEGGNVAELQIMGLNSFIENFNDDCINLENYFIAQVQIGE